MLIEHLLIFLEGTLYPQFFHYSNHLSVVRINVETDPPNPPY
ncbi:hypothetical protein CWATWH8502_1731 [Crocosphaera watsonii WH 8502]|uniref:Uncharacterized protein n=1 Tax=Crocosphaera watsonii WH 8502 TaxID=423474 RepID=T2IES3_CROWT|nr:hypothetical protein CWATWH8502_1731 [Crocosphaera watsonii WH 8502]